MRAIPSLLLSLLALAPLGAQLPAPADFAELPGERLLSGRLIARPTAAALADARLLLRPYLVREYPEVRELVIQVPAGLDEFGFASQLMAGGGYEYVTPDWLCAPVKTPDDPRFGGQWHHQNMQSELAWDVTTGDPGYVAAFVDTGVDTNHPDLAAHLVSGYNSADKLTQAAGGQIEDINGHGTAVAGCIGAIGDNGRGVAGVNWSVSLMPIRTTNQTNGNAYMSDLLDGARWAISNGAKSASVSYSGVESPSVGTTGDTIHGWGGVLLWAAGNSGTNHSGFDWANVLVIGATNPGDWKTSWSSYGRALDCMAPGENVLTTIRGGGYAGVSGTSFSTPLTNGAVAMIWAANPGWNNDQVVAKLLSSCDDLGPVGEDDTYGWGRVNVARGVDAPGLPPSLNYSLSYPYAGQDCSFTASNAQPGGQVVFFYSLHGLGTTPWPALSVDLGILQPVPMGAATADATGEANFVMRIPGGAGGLVVWTQAAEQNVASRVILSVII